MKKNTYLERINDVHINKIAKMVIGVDNVVVERVDIDIKLNCIYISARPNRWHSFECGKCGAKAPIYDAGQKERKWRCIDIGEYKCYVVSDAIRVKCPHCGVVVRKFPWAEHGSWFTYHFEQTCCWCAMNMSKSACSHLMRVQWRTVGDICKRVEKRIEKESAPLLEDLRQIGVDETSYKKGHKYMTVVINHETGAVVWCAKGHGKKVFESFFEPLTQEQRDNIELVSGDGAGWIDEVVAKWCPNAKRCIDTFHVVSWATDKLDEIRKQAWRKANEEVKKEPKRKRGRPKSGEKVSKKKREANSVKGLRYPLLKNPENLTAAQLADLEMTAISNPKLYRAYLLKEGLRLALKMPADLIREAIERWRGRAWRSRIPEFVELQRKIKRHLDAIVATAQSGITNARVEAINNGIKLIVKMAYGYRNFDNLRAMVMLKHSGLPVELPGRSVKEVQKVA